MTPLTLETIQPMLPRRPADAHKGTMGSLAALTGSYGMAGAAILSARSALRAGVGLHYQILPRAIYPIFAAAVYESVCIPVQGSSVGTLSKGDLPAIREIISKASAVLIGCGMGCTADTAAVLACVIKESKIPVVIDADGINALARHMYLLEEPHAPLILTPHLGEFARLTRLSVPQIAGDQVQAAEDFCRRYPDITLALKSHRTAVARGETVYLNTAGNSGMAKGGSGDVLAGIIASLAAQGADPLDAAAAGVHIHALAGDRAAGRLGRTAMLPEDIIHALPDVFYSLEEK
jgi:NAD(P)H-hydrate epimerase